MPRINIREFDLTTSGTSTYSNFAVVVPGVLGDNKLVDTTIFDSEGIGTFTDAKKFNEVVGKKEQQDTIAKDALAANLTPFDNGEYAKKVSQEDYWNSFNHDAVKKNEKSFLYTFEDISGVGATEGYLKKSIDLEGDEKLYKFTMAEPGKWAAGTKYVQIVAGDEGNDEKEATVGHYGNQIAYELLGLGYTVLYKLIIPEDWTEEGETEAPSILNILCKDEFWAPLADKSTYDFRYILSGLRTDLDGEMVTVNNLLASLASYNKDDNDKDLDEVGRGDIVALLDVSERVYSETRSQRDFTRAVAANVAELTNANQFSAIFAPSVVYSYSDDDYENCTFPASFHYLACAKYARSALNYAEWYAVAGQKRGLSAYNIKSTIGPQLGELTYNLLQPKKIKSVGVDRDGNNISVRKAVNIIALERGTYYLWGSRTAMGLGADITEFKASHFLNVRELCITLKKQMRVTCKALTFDPNDLRLWVTFTQELSKLLDTMRNDRGVNGYSFEKVSTSEKGKMAARIHIVPIEAVEDFDLDIYLEDSAEGVSATVTE